MSKFLEEFERPKNGQEMYWQLRRQKTRIFNIKLNYDYNPDSQDSFYFIHPNKSLEDWRQDVEDFVNKSKLIYENSNDADIYSDKLFGKFMDHLWQLGYFEIDDVVADTFEGRVENFTETLGMPGALIDQPAVRLIPDSDHESRTSGFGHYGWDNKGDVSVT